MNETWQSPEYEFLKGRRPSPNQLRHLREDLFYQGPEITDAYEACQLIDILRSDPVARLKREYYHRMKDGPVWLAWEKWMTHVSRKEHDKESWLEWWSRTTAIAMEAGEHPPELPPLPVFYQGGTYSTPTSLFTEIRELFGIAEGGNFNLEISAVNREEALLAKEQIKMFRNRLRVIDEDCQWMLTRIREGALSEDELWNLFEESVGRVINRSRAWEALQEVKKYLVNSYVGIRSMIKSLNTQMNDFRRKSKEVYHV